MADTKTATHPVAGAQPGQTDANVKDEHPERPGHGTAKGRAYTGKGNDERGKYGRGSAGGRS